MANKKRVLGVDPLSWIKKTSEEKLEDNNREKYQKDISLEVPKFETYDIKLTVRLSDKHLNYLSNIEREVMKKRSKKNRKERITKNSVIRSIINALSNIEIDTFEIPNEEELTKRIKKSILYKK